MKIKVGKEYLWHGDLYTVIRFYTNHEGRRCKSLVIIAKPLLTLNGFEYCSRIVPTKELALVRVCKKCCRKLTDSQHEYCNYHRPEIF